MREILFRGKMKYENGALKKGDWVEGHFVELIDGTTAIPHIYGYGEVFRETVGQYTGVTDINGVDVFEGDIIKSLYLSWKRSVLCLC